MWRWRWTTAGRFGRSLAERLTGPDDGWDLGEERAAGSPMRESVDKMPSDRQKHGKKAFHSSHAVEKCESGNFIAVPQPSHPQADENTGSWVVKPTVAWSVLIKRWSRLAHTVHSCAIWQGVRLSFLPSFLGCYLSLTTGTNGTLWFSFSFFFFELPTAFLHNVQQ